MLPFLASREPESGAKSLFESPFFEAKESAFSGLEKMSKSTIYSIVYDWLLCARRSVAFMAQIDQIGALYRAADRTSLKGLT